MTQLQVDSDEAQKIRQEEQRAVTKSEVKTPASFTQSSKSTISKTPSFQFRNARFHNGYFCQFLQKQNLNTIQTIPSANPSTIRSDSPEHSKVQTLAWVVDSKATEEKTESSTEQQNRLN